MEVDFSAAGKSDTAKIVITDTTDNLSVVYNLAFDNTQVKDKFVVPIGADYQINVTTNRDGNTD